MKKKWWSALALMVLFGVLVACSPAKKTEPVTQAHPQIIITMASGEVMEAELYPELAPKSVQNFLDLIEAKFYDGKDFFRAIPGFVIQGGRPLPTDPTPKNIPGEFKANGFENSLRHTEGVLSMARANDPNSASTQFFIMDGEAPHLDGQYAAFGKLTKGMEVVHQIAQLGVAGEYIAEPVVIKSIRVK